MKKYQTLEEVSDFFLAALHNFLGKLGLLAAWLEAEYEELLQEDWMRVED